MTQINGTYDKQFTPVVETLKKNLESGADIGASVAVFIDGKPVVDIWGGYLDEEKTQPWQENTIVNNFSTTKTMTALCMLILADRGLVDLDAPVAKYWPEFAQNGKGGVLVRHLLGHTSGLPGWTEPVTLEDILDREKAARLLAEQASWWEPGKDVGYHAITFGPLLGEIILRVTGKTLKRFFEEEVAGPLGADYHIGAEPEHDARVTPMIASTPIRARAGDGTITDRVFFNPYVTPQFSGTIVWRRGELGGSNGHGNARSVALVQSVLACGGEVNGVRLLSEEGCRRVLEVQADKIDLVAEFPMTWGMGYGLNNPVVSELFGNCFKGRTMAFWGGSGGSIAFNDLDARMTVAFVMNKHVEGSFDQRSVDILQATYASLAGDKRLAAQG